MIPLRRLEDAVGDVCIWHKSSTNPQTYKLENPAQCDPKCLGEDYECPFYQSKRTLYASPVALDLPTFNKHPRTSLRSILA